MNINLVAREGFPDRVRMEIRELSKHRKTHHLLANHNLTAEEMCSSQAAGTRDATDGFKAKRHKSLLGGRPPKQTFPHWLAGCSEGTFLTIIKYFHAS